MENSQLQLIDTPKGVSTNSIKEFAKKIVDEVKDGFASPIAVLVSLKSIEKATEIIKEAIMAEAVTEYERSKEGRSEMKYGNFVLAPMTAGAKYDFSNDPIWLSLKEELEEAKLAYITPLES